MNSLIMTEVAATGYADDRDTVTRGMLRQRAIELAVNDGRSALEASKSDWEQAKQEYSADQSPPGTESDFGRLNANLD